MRTCLFLLLIGLQFKLSASEVFYPVSDIPDSLKTDAYAVIRKSERTFTYKSPSSAEENIYMALTILNKNGDRSAYVFVDYDKLTSISDLKITLYDQNGKKIKKVKNDDIIDHSMVEGYSLFDDNRVKAYFPSQNSYPFTIVYEYTRNYRGLMNIPGWIPQTDNNISVQSSSYALKVASGLEVRFKEENCSHQENVEGNFRNYSWKASSIKAYENEPYMPYWPKNNIQAFIVPAKFEMEDFSGSFETWQNFGKWIYDLNKQENALSEKTKNEIHNLIEVCKTDYEKVRALYNYMQNKTRYISIQVGIGGFRPFDASITDKYGYGDCKALSNYLKAILNEAGIRSFYTLVPSSIRWRKEDYLLPRNLFDHVMLTVPLENDTLFLECTSQHCPFGFTGKSISNKLVFLIDSSGGKLIQSHRYPVSENLQSTKACVVFNAQGLGEIKSVTKYRGLQYENIYSVMYDSYDEQKKWLYSNMEIPTLEISKFVFVPDNKPLPEAKLSFEAKVSDYLTVSNKRVFLPLNLLNKNTSSPSTSKPRRFDFELKTDYVDADTIEYILPSGLKLESLPSEMNFKTVYGSYHAKTTVNGDTIQYVRNLQMNSGLYPAKDFNDFADFLKKIVKADGAKMAFLKN